MRLSIRTLTSASPAADKVVRYGDEVLWVDPTTTTIALAEVSGPGAPVDGQVLIVEAGASCSATQKVTFAGRELTAAGAMLRLLRRGGVWAVL